MHGEGFNITFSVTAIDGVSCDYKYVKISYEVYLVGNQKLITQMRIMMQIMWGELVLYYLVVVYRYFDATNNIKYMQVPMYHWREKSKNNY